MTTPNPPTTKLLVPVPRGVWSISLLIVLLIWLQNGVESLAGRGQRRRSVKVPPAVQYNTATATTLDPEDRRDLEILWGMAGQTTRRKQLKKLGVGRGRSQKRPRNNNHKDATAGSGEGSIITRQEYAIPALTDQEIEDVTIESPTNVTVVLKNGTAYTNVNPREFDQRRDFDVWMLARRQMDISASEISALVNHSVFTTRQQLLDKKTGLSPRKSFAVNSQACQWGIKMEPQALKQYCQVTGNTVEETGLWILQQQQDDENDNNLLLGASPDGIVHDIKTNTTGVLEIKCLWGRRHKSHLKPFSHCPTRFYDQIQGQLAICNDADWCDLMLFIPPSGRKNTKNYCIVRVERNQEYWDETVLPAIQQFNKDVQEEKRKSLLK